MKRSVLRAVIAAFVLGAMILSYNAASRADSQRREAQGSTIAVEGAGYLMATRDDGQVIYTRAGRIAPNADGQLTLVRSGLPLEPQITVPLGAGSFAIDARGAVVAQDRHAGAAVLLGNLQLAVFSRPQSLRRAADGFWIETEASGAPQLGNPADDGFGRIRFE